MLAPRGVIVHVLAEFLVGLGGMLVGIPCPGAYVAHSKVELAHDFPRPSLAFD